MSYINPVDGNINGVFSFVPTSISFPYLNGISQIGNEMLKIYSVKGWYWVLRGWRHRFYDKIDSFSELKTENFTINAFFLNLT